MPRAAGLLVHPTSLPGPPGLGDLGPAAEAFLDWLVAAGQSVWQVLPLGPTGHGDSPYGSLSAFAGNPLLVSLERLCAEGLLAVGEVEAPGRGAAGRADYEAARARKEPLLRAAWERWQRWADREAWQRFTAFVQDPGQRGWLDDWALYSALKARHGGAAWWEWPAPLKLREPRALAAAGAELAAEADYHRFTQYLFDEQWGRLRRAAQARGIRILGDVPFYVAPDSADVWAHRELFELDEEGAARAVAGVPPDYFSPTGQLWGNPVYRWEAVAADGFGWWIDRVRASLRLADFVRLDHFRGFAAFWRVPAGEETAAGGGWVVSPGPELFAAMRRALGDLPLVAEDLGVITPDVEALRDGLALPGTRVLQFAFGGDEGPHLPHNHVPRAVVYTGTHDNDTTRGWFAALGREERARVLDYVGGTHATIAWDLIRCAYASVAELALIPLQDAAGLDREARMNTPGRPAGNWTWRARPEDLGEEIARRLRHLAAITGRLPAAGGAPALVAERAAAGAPVRQP